MRSQEHANDHQHVQWQRAAKGGPESDCGPRTPARQVACVICAGVNPADPGGRHDDDEGSHQACIPRALRLAQESMPVGLREQEGDNHHRENAEDPGRQALQPHQCGMSPVPARHHCSREHDNADEGPDGRRLQAHDA